MGCFDVGKGESRQTGKTGAQTQAIDKAISIYSPRVGQGANVFPGERVAGPTPTQRGVFDFAEGGGFITSPEATNEFFESTTRAPALKSLRQDTIPAVREAFSGPGFWSSARATAEAKATQDAIDDLNVRRGVLDFETLEANRRGAVQALGVGGVEQQLDQQAINAEMQKFAEEHQITDPQDLAILMNLLGISVPVSTREQKDAGLGAQNIGGIAGAAGAVIGV